MTTKRADARRNYERILEVARVVVAEQGTQASLRDIARRAEVGLGTLYRHFPTRDALLETVLRQGFDRLAGSAERLAEAESPGAALREWLDEFRVSASSYRGLAASMLVTLTDPASPLYASCHAMRAAATRLLERAQATGEIRADVDGADLLALANSVSWIGEQSPQLAKRADRHFSVMMDGLAAGPGR